MIYVMSDIHDHYSRYRSVMKQIRLRKTDHLYVLGDCIDRKSLCVLRLSATIIAAELAAV